jgi:putative endonuclease
MNSYVYILASRSRAIYVGMTNDLIRRMSEHRTHAIRGHTHRYRITRSSISMSESPYAAIAGAKQIKGWRRKKKITLIETGNTTWEDLASVWFEGQTAGPSLRSG